MAVKIGHAVGSETGGREGVSGDQTGREVRLDKWYVSGSGWQWYIEAKDPALLERMAVMMEQACANPNIGYSRTNRYRWYGSAKVNGIELAEGDCDCSSLVSGIANLCGAKVTNRLATASMLNEFKRSGDFNVYTDAAHLQSDKLSRRGGIYLRVGHTLMVLENGSGVGSVPTEPTEPTSTVKPPYVLVLGGRVNVRTGAGTNTPILYEERKGSKLTFLNKDATTGWYCVHTAYGLGYISNRANLTRLVSE